MYDDVYKCVVEAGIARKLDEEVMFDTEGNIVTCHQQRRNVWSSKQLYRYLTGTDFIHR
jgi:hypothetical protein